MALDNYRELIDDLAGFATELRQAVASAGAPPEGEWDAAQIVAHLRVADELWFERLTLLMTQPEPLLRAPGDASRTRMTELSALPVDENLDKFAEQRGQIVSMLMSMTLGDWDRSGTHEISGKRTITDIVEAICDHDAEHLAQLESY